MNQAFPTPIEVEAAYRRQRVNEVAHQFVGRDRRVYRRSPRRWTLRRNHTA